MNLSFNHTSSHWNPSNKLRLWTIHGAIWVINIVFSRLQHSRSASNSHTIYFNYKMTEVTGYNLSLNNLTSIKHKICSISELPKRQIGKLDYLTNVYYCQQYWSYASKKWTCQVSMVAHHKIANTYLRKQWHKICSQLRGNFYGHQLLVSSYFILKTLLIY